MRRILVLLVLAGLAAGCGAAVEVAPPQTDPASRPVEPAQAAVLPGGDVSFTVARVGDRTRVVAVDQATGTARAEQTLQGRFDLPKLTLAGTLGGISHDGATLVLEETRRAGAPATRFAVLDAGLDEPPRYLSLDGDFSFDAMSPSAERLFLIEHLPPAGSAHYRVRMLDLATGELDPAIIVDKRFPDERMQGYPLAREESGDGLWVYTLYRDGTRNFVHALMTDGAAFCIDLPPAASPEGPWRITVERDGKRLAIANLADGAGSAIDLESLTVAAA